MMNTPTPGTLSRTKSKLIQERRGLDRAALKAMAHMLKYAADALAKELFCQRQYMSTSFWKRVQEKQSEEMKHRKDQEAKVEEEEVLDLSEEEKKKKTWYDPRFLVFEYSSGFVRGVRAHVSVYGVASCKCVREYQSRISLASLTHTARNITRKSTLKCTLDCDVNSNTTLEHRYGITHTSWILTYGYRG